MTQATAHQPVHTTNRRDWPVVAFGDIVQMVSERVDPGETELDYYVGLEHLDPESLKIRRHGTPDDVSGQKLKFYEGDIIFGKRRAYQRKLAVAHCEGICSAHAMVLRAKPKVVLPEFLPLLMQSDMFMERAVAISVGSLSPTINWKTLKVQEFPLPPVDEQRRIAQLLWAADEVVERNGDALSSLADLKRRMINRLTSLGLGDPKTQKTRLGPVAAGWKVMPLEDVVDLCQYGLSIPLHSEGQYPILRMMNYKDGKITADDLKYVDLDETDFNNFRVERDDILFNRTNSADLVGKVGIFDLDGDYVFASYLVRLRTRPDVMLPHFLNYYLNSDLGQRRMLAYATPGVSQTKISAGNLKKVLVPVPDLDEQQKIVDALGAVDDRKSALIEHVRHCVDVKERLLDSLLSISGTI